jgi:hypothetical protein
MGVQKNKIGQKGARQHRINKSLNCVEDNCVSRGSKGPVPLMRVTRLLAIACAAYLLAAAIRCDCKSIFSCSMQTFFVSLVVLVAMVCIDNFFPWTR